MASEKNELIDEQRAHLRALAEKAESAYNEFHDALTAIGPNQDFGFSCRRCPSEPGGGICSSFVGEARDPSSLCERSFCGHMLMFHVG
jgi:hypothetical protein